MRRFLLLALLLCAGCSGRSAPSFDTVMKLHAGQTYAEVRSIIPGQPDWVKAVSVYDSERKQSHWHVWFEWYYGNHFDLKTPHVAVYLTDGLVSSLTIDNIDPPKGTDQP